MELHPTFMFHRLGAPGGENCILSCSQGFLIWRRGTAWEKLSPRVANSASLPGPLLIPSEVHCNTITVLRYSVTTYTMKHLPHRRKSRPINAKIVNSMKSEAIIRTANTIQCLHLYNTYTRHCSNIEMQQELWLSAQHVDCMESEVGL